MSSRDPREQKLFHAFPGPVSGLQRHYIIKSGDRTSGDSHNFRYRIPSQSRQLQGRYRVSYAAIPNATYNINAGNNQFSIISAALVETTYTIPVGNYDSASLLAALDTLLLPGVVDSIVYSDTTGKFTFATNGVSGNATMSFNFTSVGDRSAHRILGFDKLEYAQTATQVAPNVIQLGFPRTLGVRVQEASHTDDIRTTRSHSDAYTFIVPLNSAFGEYVFQWHELFPQNVTFESSNAITELNISVIDLYTGAVVDLNNADWEFCLSI